MSNTDIKIIKFNGLSLKKDITETESGLLVWSVRAGYPRITVFTSNNTTSADGKFDYGKMIIAPFDYVTLGMLFNLIKEVIDGPINVKKSINCYNTKYVNNEKTTDIRLQAKVIIGKDADGVIYLSAVEDEKRKIKFDLLPVTKWHKLYNGDTEITNKAELSKLYATSYLNLLKKLFDKEAGIDLSVVAASKPATKQQNTALNISDSELDSMLDI